MVRFPNTSVQFIKAVCRSGEKDAYTGEQSAWNLISTYDNNESKLERIGYKA